MAHTLSITLLQQGGACVADCDLLRQAYPDGTIVFDMKHYPVLKQLKVNILWAVVLLPQAAQLDLARCWYDRALDAHSLDWKDEVKACVGNRSAAEVYAEQRLADRRSAVDDVARAFSSVGWAFAVMAGRLADPTISKASALNALSVLAQWSARCVSTVERVEYSIVMDQIQEQVFEKLTMYGATTGS